MPSTIYERKEVSPLMQKALRLYILREKEKLKQEAAEAEKNFERRVREEEEKRKKKQEELSTMEDIKDQLAQLHKKLENLRQEKHQLFFRFKRLLNDENLKKAQKHQRENYNEVQSNNLIQNRFHSAQAAASHLQLPQQAYFLHNTVQAVAAGSSIMSPGRLHYPPPHHLSSPSNSQGRKLSDQSDESTRSRSNPMKAQQVIPSSYSLSGRHNRSPSSGRIPRMDSDQFTSNQDLIMTHQAKIPRLK